MAGEWDSGHGLRRATGSAPTVCHIANVELHEQSHAHVERLVSVVSATLPVCLGSEWIQKLEWRSAVVVTGTMRSRV